MFIIKNAYVNNFYQNFVILHLSKLNLLVIYLLQNPLIEIKNHKNSINE